jgi:hypothetical protein
MSVLADRLRSSLRAGADAMAESPDLFARVMLSIADDQRRRSRIWRAVIIAMCVLSAIAAVVVAVTDVRQGELIMDWWILELMVDVALVALALWLGPLIKRFGKGYAADVFRSNPGTGKSFIVLTDFAYYLIFLAFILFTVSYEPKGKWDQTVNAAQMQHETARIGGIALIIGVLHGLNLLALPVIGRMLTLNRRLDMETPGPDAARHSGER